MEERNATDPDFPAGHRCARLARVRGDDEPAEFDTRYERYYARYSLNDDLSHVETREWAMTVLKERAVAYAKQASVTYSTSIQKAKVLAAYTRKADGRRIDAPKSNYQVASTFKRSCCKLPSWSGFAVSCALRSCATHPFRRRKIWNISNVPTCSLLPWIMSVAGIAIISSLRNCCEITCPRLPGSDRRTPPSRQ